MDAGVLEPVRRQMETLDSKVKETAVKTFNVLVEKGDDFADLVRRPHIWQSAALVGGLVPLPRVNPHWDSCGRTCL